MLSSFSKNVGMSTCIYNPEKEAGHIHVKYVLPHVDYYASPFFPKSQVEVKQ